MIGPLFTECQGSLLCCNGVSKYYNCKHDLRCYQTLLVTVTAVFIISYTKNRKKALIFSVITVPSARS